MGVNFMTQLDYSNQGFVEGSLHLDLHMQVVYIWTSVALQVEPKLRICLMVII
jgi:hypothetical protein